MSNSSLEIAAEFVRPTVQPRFGATCSDNVQWQLNRIGHIKRYDSGTTIITEGDEPGTAGYVSSGVVRVTQTFNDGRQQVVSLAMRGDFFGHFFRRGSPFLYEAATDVAACIFPQRAFEAAMARDHELEHVVMIGMLQELESSRAWISVLGRQNTLERVVSFMLFIRQRMSAAGLTRDTPIIEFPVARRDIAAFLGTTVETISRHIQALARRKIIRIIDSSHFEVLNMARLLSLSEQFGGGVGPSVGTRGLRREL